MPVIVTRGGASIKALGFAGAGKPLAPTIGTATRTSAQINVVFTPEYNGGASVTQYTATSTPGNYIFTGSQSPIAATGMTLGTDYTFTVRATNVYGDSPESASSNGVKYASAPLTPAIGTATVTGPKSVNVTYTAPANNGGEPITSYTAVSTPGGVIGTINQTGSGTISVTGLTSGTTYTFKVYATNVLGAGPQSVASNSVTPDLPTYTFSSNMLANVGGEFATEGATSSFYIDTNETVAATTLYWSVSGTGITAGDFDSGSLTGNVSITPAVRSTVNLAIRADSATEGTETFVINFYTNAGRTILLTDSAIGGYVIGNSRTVFISDTSTLSYSVAPNTSFVNEGGSVTFTVTRSDGNSSTAYWSVQAISGSVNSSDLTMSGSVSLSGGSGSFSLSPTADQTFEGSESFRILLYSDSGRSVLEAVSSTVTINDTSQYVPAGTYQGQFCAGPSNYDLYYIYADGSGGTYNQLVQSNSPQCGYVAPTISASINVYPNYVIFGPNFETKAYYVLISKGSPGPATQYWSLSGNYPPINVVGAGNGQSSGTFSGGTSSALTVFSAPHDARNFTVTVSGDGYTSFTQNFSVPANSVYSPYGLYSGWPQDTGFTYGTISGLATDIYAIYSGTGAYSTTLNPPTRWAFNSRPDVGGLTYWVNLCISNGWTASTPAFLNTIFYAAEQNGGVGLSPSTSRNNGTGYGDFRDKP